MNVGLAVSKAARRTPRAEAVFDGDRSLTYAELDARSNRLANLLRDRYGVARGDRVALLVPNRLEVVEVLAGVAKAGGTYVGMNFRMSVPELTHVVDLTEPRVLITCAELREVAQEAAGDVPVLDVDGGWDGSADPPPTLHEVRPEDDFCIVTTSGTTGTPKGVWFDHARVLQHGTVACLEYEIGPSTRYLTAIPHNSSVNITLVPCLLVGGAIGFTDSRGFDPARWADEVQRQRATHSYLVPTQLYRVLDQVPGGSAQLATIETLGYGAAPMSPDRVGDLVERFGPIFTQLYGMAEIASIGTMLRKAEHVEALRSAPHRLASAGQPSYAIDVRVVDAEGRDCPPGERGEVIFAAPYMMKGYYREPERTAQTLVDGWVRSGDVGVWDGDGYLSIVDRTKDLIVRGGYNIAPTEVEAVLHRHPAVLEVGVIGVPDPEWGEAVLAVVALRPGAAASPQELLDFARELPSVKRPERVELVDALPKNAVGKIAKNELRDRFWTGARRV